MIDSIVLTNFKAFKGIELKLGNLTLLSGLNGSGKSSVLQALGILRQSFYSNHLLGGELALNGELVEIGTGSDLLHYDFESPEVSITLNVIDQGKTKTLKWAAEVPADADVLSFKKQPERLEIPLINLLDRGFQFLRADRITPSVTYPKSHKEVQQSRFLGARGEYTGHFLLEFGEVLTVSEPMRHPNTPDSPKLISQLNAWMQEFSPGVRVEAVAVPMTDLVRLVFSFKGKGASYGKALRPTNVGFGLTHALPIVTACLAATPGKLIIIENPEAQLHPQGQVAMGQLLASTAASGVQVIVETHSDHILNGIRLAIKQQRLATSDAKLHFFSRQSGASTTHETVTVSENGRLSHWPEGFFDQWEKSLDRLLD